MKKISFFSVAMIIVVLAVIIISIIFPIRKSFLAKNDLLIESGINQLTDDINIYYNKNDIMPASLNDLELSSRDTKQLIGRNLVEYKIINNSSKSYVETVLNTNNEKTAFYELCAFYKYEKKDKYSYPNYNDPEGYQTYIDTDNHPAGKVCYKLKATSY